MTSELAAIALAQGTEPSFTPRPTPGDAEGMALERALRARLDVAARTKQAEASAWQRTALAEGAETRQRASMVAAAWSNAATAGRGA